jgi:hypothetical protein
MKLVKSTVAACLALALGSGVGAASAAALLFDDTAADDTITVRANDFEGGLLINAVLVQQGLNNPGGITLPEGVIAFAGQWIDLGQAGAGARTIYLVEARSPRVVSDVLLYSWASDPASGLATIQGTFFSDTESGRINLLPVDVDPANVFVEDGKPVAFSLPFLTGEIRSDVEKAPEPGTLALLGLGLLGWAARKKRG